MAIRNTTRLILLLFLVCAACSHSSPPNLGSITNVESFKVLGNDEFTKKKWSEATQEERAKLVYSFFEKNQMNSLKGKEITNLLGPPTGYYLHDNYPAYFIGPKNIESMHGQGYLLAFSTDDRGSVNEVILEPELY